MRNNLFLNKNETVVPDEILKVTSLIYLKDALINEKYEDCKELVRAARKFGAQQRDVRRVLAGYVRGMNVPQPFGITKKTRGGGRLRF